MTDPASPVQQLGPRLRQARLKSLLTVREVAEQLGVGHSLIVRYEQGEVLPPLDRLAGLAQVYRVSLASLLLSDETLAPIVTMLEHANSAQIRLFTQLLQQAIDAEKAE